MNIKIFLLIGSLFILCSPQVFSDQMTAISIGRSCLKGEKTCDLANNINDIIALTHFLYTSGKKFNRGQDFASGTIVFEDENKAVFNKLRDYVANKYGSKDCKEVSISLKSAYPRKSTHFNDYYRYRGFAKSNCDYAHYGIDVPANSLPMKDKKHILFGHIGKLGGKTWSFIKMEEAGLKGLDALSHGLDMIKKASTRLLPGIFQNLKIKLGLIKVEEKNFQKEFDDLLTSVETDMTESELLKNRRERIPLEFLAYYMAILLEAKDSQKLNDANYQAIKNNIKAFGVQAMADQNIWDKAIGDAELRKKLTNVADALKNRYQIVNTRFGNEIILDRSSY